jgi:hypothetical protein
MKLSPETERQLPPDLRRQLRKYEHGLRRVETMIAIAGGLCGALVMFTILFLSDRAWNTPRILRTALTMVAAASLAAFAWNWLRNWVWRQRKPSELARLIQRRHPRLGDRLQGIIEIASQKRPDQSEALSRAAIRQVATEAAAYDFSDALPRRSLRRACIPFAALLIIAAAAMLFFPGAARNAWLRLALPYSDTARYTFVSIQDIPRTLIVPRGEPFTIACAIAAQSAWHPRSATYRLVGQPATRTSFDNGQVIFELPGLLTDTRSIIRIGDVRHEILITPVYRPVLNQISAEIAMPAYLRYPTTTAAIENGQLDVLKESMVILRGRANRALETAVLDDGTARELEIDRKRFHSHPILIDQAMHATLAWRDHLGIDATPPLEIDIRIREDDAPFLECRNARRSTAILPDEVVRFNFAARDDFGVRSMRVDWAAIVAEGTAPAGSQSYGGSHTNRELEGVFVLSPSIERLGPGTTVTVGAQAIDYYPGRQPARSAEYVVRILGWQEHAEMIQREMGRLQERIEELIRDEEGVHESTQDVRDQPEEELKSAKTTAEVGAQKKSEQEGRQDLKEMAADAGEVLAKAMRNKEVPNDVLMKLAEIGQKMESVADQSMAKAVESLQEAQNSEPQRGKKLDDAIAQQKETLDELNELQRNLNKSIESMLAKSFINRLRTVAQSERGIATALHDDLNSAAGVDAARLPRPIERARREQSQLQDEATRQTEYIQNDLAGFFNRTRLEIYEAVYTNMVERATTEHLANISNFIGQNRVFKGMDRATYWSTQLDGWADLLKDAQEDASQAAAAGGEQGQILARDLELILQLIRAREQEEVIREETRKLDVVRSPHFSSNARMLSRKQKTLAREMLILERLASTEDLRRLIDKVSGEMLNVEVYLRRPQTDSGTIAIETEIIELLAAALESAQQSAQQSAGMMAGLMQMLGISGGGFTGGQNGLNGRGAGAGASVGTTGDTHGVEKSSGIVPGAIPVEFRDAVKGYLDAIQNL